MSHDTLFPSETRSPAAAALIIVVGLTAFLVLMVGLLLMLT